jgi:hypothetical protein
MITVRACQGPGKTFGLAIVLHWFGFCFYQATIPCTAPKASQVTNRLFKEFRRIRNRAIGGYANLTFMTASTITWLGDPAWFAIAETGQQPESIQGFHARYILINVDEASGVHEDMFPVVRGAISTGELAIAIFIGNPTRNTGGFADSHRRKETAPDFYRMHIPYTKSKRVKRSWVDQMIRSYGADSQAVKVRVMGDFADTEAGQLIALQWIQDAEERDITPDGSQPAWRISADVADGGVDETVICIARHYLSKIVVEAMLSFSFPGAVSPIMAGEKIADLWKAYGMSEKSGDSIVVDSLGVGAGTAGYLLKAGFSVITYKGGESSGNPDRFRNRRTQSYIGLRDALRDGTIAFNPGMATPEYVAVLEAQLCSVKQKLNADRLEDLVPKQEMLRMGLKSPDRADSLAMQFATQVPRLMGAEPQLAQTHAVRSNLWERL